MTIPLEIEEPDWRDAEGFEICPRCGAKAAGEDAKRVIARRCQSMHDMPLCPWREALE